MTSRTEARELLGSATDSYLLDTNVIDEILKNWNLGELMVQASNELGVNFYVTHLAIDEVEKISPDRDEHRIALLQILAQLPADRIATSVAVLDVSRFDEARFGDEDDSADFERLIGGNPRHAEDAIVALTARSIVATIVSFDRDLRRMARQIEIKCVTPDRLLETLRARLADSAG